MSTLRVNTIQDTAGSGSPSIAGAAKAWVNFNGAGTVAIRAALNVSSITDLGVGDYTVNFATALPDASYAITSTGSNGNADGLIPWVANNQTAPNTSAFRIRYGAFNGTLSDATYQSIAVFR